ncbi:thiamine pyrophosphate-binding protein [Leucobacter sp. UCMA 4100]|nr:thiamine pyrophosphate-binding protein [Leucobacter sp. UCMA 4100]MDA3146961.1 thiamine pyrophosphate-binding protein [Leucobacter sp. UCMA 4100]
MIPQAESEAALAAGVTADNVGLAMLKAIRGYGVDTVFGIPGTHNLEFYRHFERLGFHAVTTRHEQGAGYAADAWSQRTGLPGVVITTSGPGLLNALSAAGTAYCESRPMIIVSPGVPQGEEFADIGSLHETKDQVAAAAAIVEWARRVQTAEEAIEAVHDAFQLFHTSRPRPVYIEVPLNLLEGPCDVPAEALEARVFESGQALDPELVRAAAATLRDAKRPAILAGGGSVSAHTELRALAERLGAPVATSLNGKGALPEAHPLSLGSDLRLESVRAVLNEADALLVVGSKIGQSELWGGEIAPSGELIRVDILESQRHKNARSTQALIGDATEALEALLAELGAAETSPEPVIDVARVKQRSFDESAAFAPLEDGLAKRIAAILPEDAIVTGDSSQITYYGMSTHVRSAEPGAFMYMAAYATLGYGLPAAIGAKVASPEQPVIGVIGDGALMFSIQELMTAVEQGLDITIVCVDNGGYGEIQQNEADRGIAPVGVQLAQPNWPALVEAFGGKGFAVTTEADLEPVIREAIAVTGVTLVHVPLALFAAELA